MFLSLQILFELKMPTAAAPILDLLDMKAKEMEKVIEQKTMIKNQPSSTNDSNSS